MEIERQDIPEKLELARRNAFTVWTGSIQGPYCTTRHDLTPLFLFACRRLRLFRAAHCL
jgi:hypothetical protein